MPKLLAITRSIIKFFANMMSNIFVIILAGIVGVPALIAWATGTLDFLIQSINTPVPLWETIALAFLSGLYVYLKTSKLHSFPGTSKPKYYKYCPDCDVSIDANNPEKFCQCGTKYFEKCPQCGKNIIRENGRYCAFCGEEFPLDRIPI